jgi:hypothetical protein
LAIRKKLCASEEMPFKKGIMKANKREEKSEKELDSAVYSLIANSQLKELRKKRDTTGSSPETEAE